MCGEASFQILILPFFLSPLVICSTLEKHLLKTTFSHLKNTQKSVRYFFPLCSLRTSKTAKRKFYKIRKNMCWELRFYMPRVRLQWIFTAVNINLSGKKVCWRPRPTQSWESFTTLSHRLFLHVWEPTPGYPLLDYPESPLPFASFSSH